MGNQLENMKTYRRIAVVGVSIILIFSFYLLGKDLFSTGRGSRSPILNKGKAGKLSEAPRGGNHKEEGGNGQMTQRAKLPTKVSEKKEESLRKVAVFAYWLGSREPLPGVRISFANLKGNPLDPSGILKEGVLQLGDNHPIIVHTNGKGVGIAQLVEGAPYLVKAPFPGALSLGNPLILGPFKKRLLLPFSKQLSVWGKVFQPNGKPLKGAKVTFCAAEIIIGKVGIVRPKSVGLAWTNKAGVFKLTTKKQLRGRYYLCVSHPDFPPSLSRSLRIQEKGLSLHL